MFTEQAQGLELQQARKQTEQAAQAAAAVLELQAREPGQAA